ncbi:MAG: type II secretion system F family protein [Planctomycetota bacterium]|jgi:tight adherence protein C
MYEQLIPLLTFLSVVTIGGAILVARAMRRQPLQNRLQAQVMEGQYSQPKLNSEQSWLIRMLDVIGGIVSSGGPSAGLQLELAKAGYHSHGAAVVYLGIKILLVIVGMAGLTIVLIPIPGMTFGIKVFIIFIGTGFFFFIPNLVIRYLREKRRDEVRRYLPDTIDLLEICVSAGMGLDMAWNSVANEARGISPILADEMALTNLEMHLGAPRSVAMRHMAERTGAAEISSLVGVLVQSDRFGTSISDALRTYAASMRETRSQRAEEAAEKMPVKLLFPLALLIFPAVLIVICGPAGIEWARIITGGI